jgi:hypothetical protein
MPEARAHPVDGGQNSGPPYERFLEAPAAGKIHEHQADQHGEQPLAGNARNRHREPEGDEHDAQRVARHVPWRTPRADPHCVRGRVFREVRRWKLDDDHGGNGQRRGGRDEPDAEGDEQRDGRHRQGHGVSIVY